VIPRFEYNSFEAKVMSEANHPHLVKYLGQCSDERNVYVFTEYYPIGELFCRMAASKAGLSEAETAFHALCVFEALQCLHAQVPLSCLLCAFLFGNSRELEHPCSVA